AAALAGGAALGAPMLQSALQRAAPQLLGPGAIKSSPAKSLEQTIEKMAPTAMPNTSIANSQIQTSQPPISPSIPNATSTIQPEVKNINASEILNKYGLTKHVEEISKNFKDPKGVAAVLYNKFPKEMQRLQKEAGKPMEDVVAEYMANVKPLDIEKPEDDLGFN